MPEVSSTYTAGPASPADGIDPSRAAWISARIDRLPAVASV